MEGMGTGAAGVFLMSELLSGTWWPCPRVIPCRNQSMLVCGLWGLWGELG